MKSKESSTSNESVLQDKQGDEIPKINIFTEILKNDIINHRSIDFMESAILSIILLMGMIVILCNKFNAITNIIYIIPCVVSSLARIAKVNKAQPIYKVHVSALFASIIVTGAMVAFGCLNQSYYYLSYCLFIYPVYELICTFTKKTELDNEIRKMLEQ